MEIGDQSDYDYKYNASHYDYEFEEDEDLSDIECQMYPEFQVALLIYSILVLILYVALQKRVKLRSKILSGHFGLPIPINFVHETKDRWVYAAVFGAKSGTFVQLVFNGALVSPQGYIDGILRGFILFLTMLFIPLLFFAMIASVHGRIQVLTHAIGLAYVGTALAQQVLLCIDCHQVASTIEQGIYRTFQYVDIYGTVIPIMLCNVLTGIYFLVRGIQAVITIITGKPFTSQKDVQHHLGYVKLLLARNSITEPSSNPKATEKLAILIKRYVYKRDPYFKYPVRLLSITSVVVVGLLVVTVQLLSFLITTVRFVEDSVAVGSESDVVKRLIDVAYAFAVIIPIVSYSITVISFLLSIKAYKDHCKRIWKGDDFFKPIRKHTPANILVRSTFYVGWQIGMVLWAWLFYVILMIILVVTIVIVVLLLIYVPEIREWIVWRAILLASTTITGLIFTVVQGLIARYLFAKGKTLIVNNSRLFHIYTYFLLFYNALIGMGKAMRRIFTSAIISLFFLPRLDRSLLIEGFQKFDKGYIAYLSAVRLDAAYNNPVLNVFVYLLSQERTSYNTTSILDRFTIQNYYQDTQPNTVNEYKLKPLKSKARKMWYLAYTLVRNTDLLELRRRSGMDSKTNTIVEITSNSDTTAFGIANELAENYDDNINNSEVKENP